MVRKIFYPKHWIALGAILKERYSLSSEYNVVSIEDDFEEYCRGGQDIISLVKKHVRNGMYQESAINEAVEDHLIVKTAPQGYCYVGLAADDKPSLTLMVDINDIPEEVNNI